MLRSTRARSAALAAVVLPTLFLTACGSGAPRHRTRRSARAPRRPPRAGPSGSLTHVTFHLRDDVTPLTAATVKAVGVLHDGRLVEVGPTAEVFDHPQDPYTAELVGAISGRSATLERSTR